MRALPLWVRGELSPKVGINEDLGWECSRAAQKPVRETGKKILGACLAMAKTLLDVFNLIESKEYQFI